MAKLENLSSCSNSVHEPFCFQDMTVHSGDIYSSAYSVDKLLTWSKPEAIGNFWLAPDHMTGGGFILKISSTTISKIQLVNTHNTIANDRGTKSFKIYVSLDLNSSWTLVLEEELADSRTVAPAPINKFNIQPVSARYVKFELVSFWGLGGGLQYFNII